MAAPDLVPAVDVTPWANRHGITVTNEDRQAACGVVRAYCRWHVATTVEATFRVRHDESGLLVLPTMHLVDVVLVKSGDALVEHDWETNGLVHLLGAPKARTVEVTVRHGHDETPDGVLPVVLNVLGRGLSNPRGLVQAQETRGPVSRSESYGASANDIGALGLLESEQRQLAQHRLAP